MDNSGAIEKREMAEFLDSFINKDKDKEDKQKLDLNLPSAGPGLQKKGLIIGTPGNKFSSKKVIQERDVKMKKLSGPEQIEFLKKWHEDKK